CSYLTLYCFFNHPPTTEIYTLSLHDALPIYPAPGDRGRAGLSRRGDDPGLPPGVAQGAGRAVQPRRGRRRAGRRGKADADLDPVDRKSTRLNSSHVKISYAVFCLKKKIM